ncbi:unnamed protein product [Prorocentrum cordatum]|uniref:Uncharacterized protein n=1 Tax=Prorocentrum cordatum TaxID=2364126 RepID=A0ABN9YE18_9DINO|nr:unnamed protein product [Polarella glacialis]
MGLPSGPVARIADRIAEADACDCNIRSRSAGPRLIGYSAGEFPRNLGRAPGAAARDAPRSGQGKRQGPKPGDATAHEPGDAPRPRFGADQSTALLRDAGKSGIAVAGLIASALRAVQRETRRPCALVQTQALEAMLPSGEPLLEWGTLGRYHQTSFVLPTGPQTGILNQTPRSTLRELRERVPVRGEARVSRSVIVPNFVRPGHTSVLHVDSLRPHLHWRRQANRPMDTVGPSLVHPSDMEPLPDQFVNPALGSIRSWRRKEVTCKASTRYGPDGRFSRAGPDDRRDCRHGAARHGVSAKGAFARIPASNSSSCS